MIKAAQILLLCFYSVLTFSQNKYPELKVSSTQKIVVNPKNSNTESYVINENYHYTISNVLTKNKWTYSRSDITVYDKNLNQLSTFQCVYREDGKKDIYEYEHFIDVEKMNYFFYQFRNEDGSENEIASYDLKTGTKTILDLKNLENKHSRQGYVI